MMPPTDKCWYSIWCSCFLFCHWLIQFQMFTVSKKCWYNFIIVFFFCLGWFTYKKFSHFCFNGNFVISVSGHLHTGNIVIDKSCCKLLDLENWLLGLPSYYRQNILQFKKIQVSILMLSLCSCNFWLYSLTSIKDHLWIKTTL